MTFPYAERVLEDSRYGASTGTTRPLGQWGLVGVLGLVLGLATLSLTAMASKWTFLLAMVMLFPCLAAIIGDVRRLCLAVILLDFPLQLDVHLFYDETLANLGAFGGINVSVTTFMLLVLYALWFYDRLTLSPNALGPARLRSSLPLLGYLAINALSIWFAQDRQLSLFKLLLLVQTSLLYIYIVSTVQTRQDILFILTLIWVGLALEGLIMVGLRLIGHSIEMGVGLARIDGARIGGTLGGPNTTGAYMSLLLAPPLAVLMTRLGRYYKVLGITAFGLGTLALLLTFSRGGWMAFVLSITLLYGLSWCRGWLSLTLPMVMAAATLLIVVFCNDLIISRLTGDDAGAAYSRLPLMTIAYRMILDNPFFGVGLNNFTVAMPRYADLEFAGYWFYIVHNKYLIVWAETGLCGITTFLWFLVTILYRGWQAWQFKDRLISPFALGFTVAIVGQMLHMHFDTFQTRPAETVYFSAALITALYHLGHADRRNQNEQLSPQEETAHAASTCAR